jgi:hypothetical protein
LTTNLNSEISTRGTQIGNLQVTTPNGASVQTPPVGGSTTTYTSTTTALQALQNQIGKLNGSGFNDMKSYVDGTFVTPANAVTTATLNSTIGSLTAPDGTAYSSVRSYLDANTSPALNITPVSVTTPVCINVTGNTVTIAGINTTCVTSNGNNDWKSIPDMVITTPSLVTGRKVLVVGSINVQVTGASNNSNVALAVRLTLDGVAQTDNTFTINTESGGAGEVVVPLTQTLTTTSTGTHTIGVQWTNTAGLTGSSQYFFSVRRILSATSGN